MTGAYGLIRIFNSIETSMFHWKLYNLLFSTQKETLTSTNIKIKLRKQVGKSILKITQICKLF